MSERGSSRHTSVLGSVVNSNDNPGTVSRTHSVLSLHDDVSTHDAASSTYVGGVVIDDGGSDAAGLQSRRASVASSHPSLRRTSLPPPPPPPPAPPASAPTTPAFPCDSLWDVIDWEIVGRGTTEAEAFSALAYLASEMRKIQDGIQLADATAAARLEEAVMTSALEVQEKENATRGTLSEAEDIAWGGLIEVLTPLKMDIIEEVGVRQRRVERRNRKIAHLQELLLTKKYEAEWSKAAEKRRNDADWAAFVQKAYIKTGQRLEECTRREIEAKMAAASEEIGFTRPAPEFESTKRPTLYGHLVNVQLQDAAEHRRRRETDADPFDLERHMLQSASEIVEEGFETPHKGFLVSPNRRRNERKESPSQTPFAVFGPGATGPFSEAKMYGRSV